MVQYFVNGLESYITGISWIDIYGGMTRTITRKVKNREGAIVEESYPVTHNLPDKDCWDNSLYQLLTPDEGKKSLAFWHQSTPVAVEVNPNIAAGMGRTYTQIVGLYVWLNLRRMNLDNDPDITGAMLQELAYAIDGKKVTATTIKGKARVRHSGVMPHTEDIFAAWSWGQRNEMFFGDYDFFGLEFEFKWLGIASCAPTITPSVSPEC